MLNSKTNKLLVLHSLYRDLLKINLEVKPGWQGSQLKAMWDVSVLENLQNYFLLDPINCPDTKIYWTLEQTDLQ